MFRSHFTTYLVNSLPYANKTRHIISLLFQQSCMVKLSSMAVIPKIKASTEILLLKKCYKSLCKKPTWINQKQYTTELYQLLLPCADCLINNTCKPEPGPKYTFPISGMCKKIPNPFLYELVCGLLCHTRSALIDLCSAMKYFPPCKSLCLYQELDMTSIRTLN